jgi:hypothetical protein
MDTAAEAVSAYERSLADLQDAYAVMDDTLRTIADTMGRLRNWPCANADLLIDTLPLDWPDAPRLVAVIASYGRAMETALQAWSAISLPLRDSVAAPEQFLSNAEERAAPSGVILPAETMPSECP